jgi:hypothetical protein
MKGAHFLPEDSPEEVGSATIRFVVRCWLAESDEEREFS